MFFRLYHNLRTTVTLLVVCTSPFVSIADPTISSLIPSTDEDAWDIRNGSFRIQFNTSVKRVSGKAISLFKADGDILIQKVSLRNQGYFSIYQHFSFTNLELDPTTSYYVLIDAGSFVDQDDNAYGGISDKSEWSFSTEESESDAPNHVTFDPVSGQEYSDNVLTQVRINFDESVRPIYGREVSLYKSERDILISKIRLEGVSYSTGQYEDFAPIYLDPSTDYYFQIETDAFRDAFNNSHGGISDKTTWSFTTEDVDTSPPVISSRNPVHEFEDHPIELDYSRLSFNENVKSVNGKSIYIFNSDDVLVEEINLRSGQFDEDFYYYTYTQLEPSTTYYYQIDQGAFVDGHGNEFVGILDNTSWTITTIAPDTESPTISSFNPNGNSDVEVDEYSFYLYFNEEVKKVAGKEYQVYNADDELIESASFSEYGGSNSFKTEQGLSLPLLDPSTEYYILIDQGAFVDAFGNEFQGIQNATTWAFTTEAIESVAPIISGYNPPRDAVNISSHVGFNIWLNEEVKKVEGKSINLFNDSDELIQSFEPAASSSFSEYQHFGFAEFLAPNSSYYIEIDQGAFVDPFGNEFQGLTKDDGWWISTRSAENDPPKLIGTTPLNGADEVELGLSTLSLNFDEEVRAVSGKKITVVNASHESQVFQITLNEDDYWETKGYDLNRLILTPGESYSVQIEEGAFIDLFGNEFAGILNDQDWSFTAITDDTNPPYFVELEPDNNETEIDPFENSFGLTFNEFVLPVAGKEISVFDNSNDELIATKVLSESTYYTKYPNIYFANLMLQGSKTYYVTVEQGAYVDLFGNEFEGFSDNSLWKFSTRDFEEVPPTAIFSPENNATNIGVFRERLSLRFSENVSHDDSKKIGVYDYQSDELIDDLIGSHNIGTYFSVQIGEKLEASTKYYVLVEPGKFSDAFGNSYAGITDKDIWTFTAEEGDEEFPEISSLSPNDNSAGFLITKSSATIRFDNPVTTVGGKAAYLYKSSGDVLIANDIQYSTGYYNESRTFNFNNDLLEPDTEYYITIDPGCFIDLFGNEFEGIEDKTSWTFTTESSENDSPMISSFSPSAGFTDFNPLQRGFSITTNEPVKRIANKTYTLLDYDTDEIVATTAITFSNSNFSTNTFFNFNYEALQLDTKYYINIEQGAFQDAFSNEFEGLTNKDVWSFTTKSSDLIEPELLYLSPANGSENIYPYNAILSINFNEIVKNDETKLIKVFEYDTDDLIYSQDLDGIKPNNGFSFNVPTILKSNTKYYVLVESDKFSDGFDNYFEGISDKNEWTFTTRPSDGQGPVVLSSIPDHEATEVSVLFSNFTFNLDESSFMVPEKSFKLFKKQGDVLIIDYTLPNYGSNYLTSQYKIYPNALLEPSTEYYINIEAGAFTDIFGNPSLVIDDNESLTFTTEEDKVEFPLLVELTPANESEENELFKRNYRIVFGDVVRNVEGKSIHLYEKATGLLVASNVFGGSHFYTSFSINMGPGFLKLGTEYYLQIDAGAFEDRFGNTFDGISDDETWAFKTITEDTSKPEVTSLTPFSGSTNRAVDRVSYTLNFNEPVIRPSSTKAYLYKYDNDELISETEIFSSSSSSTYQNIYFNLILAPSTQYYILIDEGAYEDLYGNNWNGITDKDFWAFTTEPSENIAPTVTFTTPDAGAIDVQRDIDVFQIGFDESVRQVDGKKIEFYSSDGTLIHQIELEETWFSSSYYLEAPENFEFETQYYVNIETGAYIDAFGNGFEGIQDSETWNFTIEDIDTDAPQAHSFYPNIANASVITGFSIQFDENVSFVPGKKFQLFKTDGDELVDTFLYTNTQNPDDYWRINFDLPLSANTSYYILIDASAFEDEQGNEFEGVQDKTTWTFTTQQSEDVKPSISSVNPNSTTSNVPLLDVGFNIAFNEPAQGVSGKSLSLYKYDDEELVTTISYNGGGFIGPKYFHLPNSIILDPDTKYYLNFGSDIFHDIFFNYHDGVNDKETWSFTTEPGEEVPPAVTGLNPSNQYDNVAITKNNFSLDFDEQVQRVEGKKLTIYNFETDDPIQVFTFSSYQGFSYGHGVSTNEIFLEPGVTYYVNVEQGAVRDIYGNEFEGILDKTSWVFTTQEAEFEPPQLSYFLPLNGSLEVSVVNLSLQYGFNEEVKQVGGKKIQIFESETDLLVHELNLYSRSSYSSSYYESISSNNNLKAAIDYYILIEQGSYVDFFGNEFEGITDKNMWTFRTVEPELIPPTISPSNPSNNANGIDIFKSFYSAYFNEGVKRTGNGFASIVNSQTDEVVSSQAIRKSNSYSVWQYFNFNGLELLPGTAYHLNISEGAFEDYFGNKFEGINDATTWAFQTKDVESDPPEIRSLRPENFAANVNIGPNFRIGFDELVIPITGKTIRIWKAENQELITEINATGQRTTTYYFYAVGIEFEIGESYFITIEEGAFTDVFGNDFPGIQEGEWLFTIEENDLQKPQITTFSSPSSGGVIFPEMTYADYYFDEPVQVVEGKKGSVYNSSDDSKAGDFELHNAGLSTYQYMVFEPGILELNQGNDYYINIEVVLIKTCSVTSLMGLMIKLPGLLVL